MAESLRVLVTGASSGFGALIVRTLAAAGHRVFATLRDASGRNAPAAAALGAWAAEGGHALWVAGLDVTAEAEADAVVAQMVETLGGIDVVVHNAGVAAAGLVETFTPAAAQRIFDVNVIGVQRVMRAALPTLRAQGQGLVVYMSSVLAREVTPFLGLYVASKFAVDALAEAYRYELTSLGIETAIIQPGTFPTTSILANLVPVDDGARADGYGPLRDAPGQFFGGLSAMVAAGAAPDPQQVADAVLAVLAAPAGQRPVRVPVDPLGIGGAARLNAAAEGVQSELLGHFGLLGLLAGPSR